MRRQLLITTPRPRVELGLAIAFAVLLVVVPLLPGGRPLPVGEVLAACTVGLLPIAALLGRAVYSLRHPDAVQSLRERLRRRTD